MTALGIIIIAFFLLIMAGAFLILEKKEIEEKARKKQEEERFLNEETERLRREIEDLYRNDPEGYFHMVLDTFDPFVFDNFKDVKDFDEVKDLSVVFNAGILGIETEMPSKDIIRDAISDQYLTKSGSVRANFETSILPKVYEDRLYRLCLRTVYVAFKKDLDGIVRSVLFNGYVTDYSKTTGQLERKLIMSLLVSAEQFSNIDINHVEPKACFKALKGVSAAKLIDIVPVTPVLELNKSDRRFIESKEVKTDKGTNLASMAWDDFEQLVRDLFETEFAKNGGEVKVTQASRDGGVDAVVFDPDPLRGGKIVIQAKRYTNTVPVSAVRDLYGTVINEGANTGILITTSDYGPDSYEFAKDKPIKLLNGGNLLGLMERNGRQAYINLKEAKETISEERKSIPEAPPKDLFGFEQ